MSQTSAVIGSDKLKVILSICQYLSQEIDTCGSSEIQESLTVAVQCIEAAYGISYENLMKTTNIPDLWKSLVTVDENASTQAETYKQKGNDLMSAGCFKEAVESYSRAVELNPKNAVYYCNRAAAYCRLENYDEAVADCKTAVKLDSNYSKAYGRLGLAYLSQKSHAQAVDAYGTAIRLDPTNEMYKQNFKIAMDLLRSENGGREPNLNATARNPIGNAMSAPNVQSAFNQIVNNPNLLNMASEMLSDESVRNAMTGLIQMRAQNAGNPSMENLLLMGQQLAQQMQQEHPDFIESLRQQFSDGSNSSPVGDQASNISVDNKNSKQDQVPDQQHNA